MNDRKHVVTTSLKHIFLNQNSYNYKLPMHKFCEFKKSVINILNPVVNMSLCTSGIMSNSDKGTVSITRVMRYIPLQIDFFPGTEES